MGRRKPVQQRSQERVQAILKAAEHLLLHGGYEAMTTSQLAKDAGISVGSLYQFFKNKEDVLNALAVHYLQALGQTMDAMFAPNVADMRTEDAISQTVDLLVSYLANYPAYLHIIGAGWLSEGVREIINVADQRVTDNIEMLLITRGLAMEPAHRRIAAVTVVHLFNGLLPVLTRTEEANHEITITEFKRAVTAYIDSLPKREA